MCLNAFHSKFRRSMSGWRNKGLILLLVVAAGWASLAQNQTSKDLKKKEEALKNDIKTSEKILSETKKGVKASQTQVAVLSTKIRLHEDLIGEYRDEVHRLNDVIAENEALVEALENDMQELKTEYSRIVYNTYKTRHSHRRVMFVFAAESFNQAYHRLKYMQEFSVYRQQQAATIAATRDDIARKNQELEVVRAEKTELLDKVESEKSVLARERNNKSKTLTSLKSRQEELKKELRKKKKEASQLAEAIKKAIEREIAANKNKVVDVALSADFAKNQKKLPFPTESGIITGKFGTHPDPVYPSFTIQNNGVDISTTKGAQAKAVFKGKVSGVFIIPGSGKVVMVRHGEYTTVYSNLKEVFVKMGEEIDVQQAVGEVLSDNDQSKLHFEVWKGQTPQDPAKWLFKSR